MTERSRFWDGLTTGDATDAPYDASTKYAAVQSSLAHAAGMTNQGGVFPNQLNKLAPTAAGGNASPVLVDTGRALVHGQWYENDASISTAIPTPGGATRIDRLVLRKSWASETVRLTLIAGVEGGSEPALTQSLGVTWDIPICSISITTGGVITLTDEREALTGQSSGAADATKTITNERFYANTAASPTVHLPSVVLNGEEHAVAFEGTGTMTLDAGGTTQIFDTALVTSVSLSPGDVIDVHGVPKIGSQAAHWKIS